MACNHNDESVSFKHLRKSGAKMGLLISLMRFIVIYLFSESNSASASDNIFTEKGCKFKERIYRALKNTNLSG
ncbi:MAG: hypothetical protein PGMFKBFP_00422 [Anaerolineales bacterium]|nr:hypothetical protein [Anaerolineales bacterium]